MSNQITFTEEELKQFSKTSPFTIIELSKFIEDKTNQQYVIVQKEFVKAISKQLNSNTLYIFEINNFINEIWAKIVSTNQQTTDEWKEHLKVFKG